MDRRLLYGKSFSVEHYMQTFKSDVVIHAMLIGTIDLHYHIPLSLTLTLAWGHKVSAMQNLIASFSRTLFN